MPPTIAIGAFVFGAVLLLIALVGGSFELFGIKMEKTAARPARIFAGIAGVILLYIGVANPFEKPSPPAQTATTQVGSLPTPPPSIQSVQSENSRSMLQPTAEPTAKPTTAHEAAPRTKPVVNEDFLVAYIESAKNLLNEATLNGNSDKLEIFLEGDALEEESLLVQGFAQQGIRYKEDLQSISVQSWDTDNSQERASIEIIERNDIVTYDKNNTCYASNSEISRNTYFLKYKPQTNKWLIYIMKRSIMSKGSAQPC